VRLVAKRAEQAPTPQFENPPAAQPTDEKPSLSSEDPLSLAAECLQRGDDASAAEHLDRHLARHPDHAIFRMQLAELLLKLDRVAEAQSQFETVAAQSQDGPPAARERLVHGHTRLMEIARLRNDEYAEHLHRGIGLYFVGKQLAEKGEVENAERLLCKAAAALKEAQSIRPDEARPAWYLYRVWTQLDQPRPAEQALVRARSAAAFSALTPSESRQLALAGPSPLVLK
jgi:tetratricopeptide (TPR) repeat protein